MSESCRRGEKRIGRRASIRSCGSNSSNGQPTQNSSSITPAFHRAHLRAWRRDGGRITGSLCRSIWADQVAEELKLGHYCETLRRSPVPQQAGASILPPAFPDLAWGLPL